MKHLIRWTLFTACALTSISAVWTQDYTYRLKVKEGDVFKYKLTAQITTESASLNISGETTLKVVKVESDGKVVCEYNEGEIAIKSSTGSTTVPAEKPFRVTYRSCGLVDRVEIAEDTTPLYFFQMPFPEHAVKKNEWWEGTITDNRGEGSNAQRMQILGSERVGDIDTWKIGISDKATPSDFHSYLWVDAKTGAPVKYEFTYTSTEEGNKGSLKLKAELIK